MYEYLLYMRMKYTVIEHSQYKKYYVASANVARCSCNASHSEPAEFACKCNAWRIAVTILLSH